MNKKGTFYIVNCLVCYGSASSNRLLAYANSAAAMGYNVKIIALLRLDMKDYHPREGVSVKGLKPCFIKNKVLSKVFSFFATIWFLIKDVCKEDRILLYGSCDYLPIFWALSQKQLYFEVTECPDLFPPRIYSVCLYRWLIRHLQGIFVISSNLKEYFTNYGVKPERVHVINMIVDMSRFEGVKQNDGRDNYIAYCGNITNDSKDGVSDLIRAYVSYQKIYPDCKLYLIGSITSIEQKSKYEAYLKTLKVCNSVLFIGSVSPNIIPQYFVDAEMLVLARPNNIQAKYGFPTKVGEYLLSGRPNVLTNVGNISDFLKDGENAYIVEPENVNDLANKMIQVSKDKAKANEVGRRGRDTAIKYFNSKIETEKIIKLIFK